MPTSALQPPSLAASYPFLPPVYTEVQNRSQIKTPLHVSRLPGFSFWIKHVFSCMNSGQLPAHSASVPSSVKWGPFQLFCESSQNNVEGIARNTRLLPVRSLLFLINIQNMQNCLLRGFHPLPVYQGFSVLKFTMLASNPIPGHSTLMAAFNDNPFLFK